MSGAAELGQLGAVTTVDASGNVAFTNTVSMGSSFLRNRIINGDMRIDQRNAGASVTINAAINTYVLDRWFGVGQATDGVFTLARTTVGLSGFTHSAVVNVTTADASVGATQAYAVAQKIEGNNVSDFSFGTASAKTITLSFWIYSSVSGTFGGAIANEAHNRSCPFSYTISATNTWEYKTVTIPGDTGGTWVTDSNSAMRVIFSVGAGSTYKGTAGTWAATTYWSATGTTDHISTLSAQVYLTGVQLEAGTVATPFERRQYGQELALCQRYFQTGSITAISYAASGFNIGGTCSYKVTMRAAPTVTQAANNYLLTQSGITATTSSYLGDINSVTAFRATTATGTCQFSESLTASAEL